jgi:hypothetical protein
MLKIIEDTAPRFTLDPEFVELVEMSEELSNRFFVVIDTRRDDRKIAPVAFDDESGRFVAELHLARIVDVDDLIPTR